MLDDPPRPRLLSADAQRVADMPLRRAGHVARGESKLIHLPQDQECFAGQLRGPSHARWWPPRTV